MQRNLKLVIAYDVTGFHGWQQQPGVRTVQEVVQTVVRRVVRHPAQVIGASRTDAGVHARGQVAHLLTDCVMPAARLRHATAHRLPPDVTLVDAAEVPMAFHAARHARSKLYCYAIHNSTHFPVEDLGARYTWHVWFPLDLDRMRLAAAELVGRHDFAPFANKGSSRESSVRTIRRIGIRRRYERVLIDVEGDGFLYNQVRIVVGTLVEVGRGHWPPQRMREILASRDRGRAGPTAPPQGLCLQWVRYEASGRSADGA